MKREEFYNYYFTGETRQFDGVELRRIARCGDGQLGGWIEKRENLIIEPIGTPAWVGDDAKVYGNAIIHGAAQIKDWAVVRGSAVVCETATVEHSSTVKGNAVIRGGSRITHSAKVSGVSIIEDSTVRGEAKVNDAKLKFCDIQHRVVLNGGDYYNRRYYGSETHGTEWYPCV